MLVLFTASECRAFLLYYLPVLLHGILTAKYLAHAMILAKAIRLLLGEVSRDNIDTAEQLLLLFWRLMGKYYGQYLIVLYKQNMLIILGSCYWSSWFGMLVNLQCIMCTRFFGCLGLQHCSMNVHLLSYLPFYVRHNGPLWTHSAFCFEDGIGHLMAKAHGTHNIANQV